MLHNQQITTNNLRNLTILYSQQITTDGLRHLTILQKRQITNDISQYSTTNKQLKITFKGSIFLKNRHFIIQERINKLIYGINTIINCGIWQPVKFQLVSRSWNGMIFFYHISELMLPILIQRYDKKIISFLVQLRNERLTEILQTVRRHILWSY